MMVTADVNTSSSVQGCAGKGGKVVYDVCLTTMMALHCFSLFSSRDMYDTDSDGLSGNSNENVHFKISQGDSFALPHSSCDERVVCR
jgi:hypothetical protein